MLGDIESINFFKCKFHYYKNLILLEDDVDTQKDISVIYLINFFYF